MAEAESSDTPWVSLFSVAYDPFSGYVSLGACHYYPFYVFKLLKQTGGFRRNGKHFVQVSSG